MRFPRWERSLSSVGWTWGFNSRFASLHLWRGTYAAYSVVFRVLRFTRTVHIGKPWEAGQ